MATASRLPAIVVAAGLAVIAGFFFFQYGLHLRPCELCLEERWPWYVAAAAGLTLLLLPHALPARLAAAGFLLLFAVSAVLALRHVAVEQHWIAGPASCTGAALSGSIDEMREALLATPPVRCDVVPWSLFGVSLAGWNALASLALALLAALCLRRGGR